jgi:hypothetical protein
VSSRPDVFAPSAYEAQRRHDAVHAVTALLPEEEKRDAFEETPSTFAQALATPEAEQWIAAVRSELSSFLQNNTYSALPDGRVPRGRYPVPGRFVLRIKRLADRSIDKFKARVVAKGFMTRKGVDYFESFAPTLRHATFRLLCAKACFEGWPLHQLDATTAFLVPPLDTKVYFTFPEFGLLRQYFADILPEHPNVLLNKALYGLVNSPRLWHRHLQASLVDMGLEQSSADPCLFTLTVDGVVVASVGVFVDDLAITGTPAAVESIKTQLKANYKMTDGGEMNWFLSVAVARDLDAGTLALSQEAAIAALLEEYKMTGCNPSATPAEPCVLNVPKELPAEEVAFMKGKPYRAVVGSLLYLLFTRPDISFAVGQLARHLNNPSKACWTAAMRVLKYLKGTASLKLTFTREEEKTFEDTVRAFSDADYAGDKQTRRSTTGFAVMACGATVTSKSQLQRAVTLSSCESEIVALSKAVQEVIWVRRVLASLDFDLRSATPVFEDNAAVLSLVRDHRFSERTKHVDIKALFIHDHIGTGEVEPLDIASTDNPADIFTKPLGRVLFQKHRLSLGLR